MTAENKNQAVAALLAIGLLLVGVSVYFSFFAKETTYQQALLARVSPHTGKSFILRKGLSEKRLVEEKTPVYNLDSVETLDTGEAVLNCENTCRVHVLDNALVTLEMLTDEKSPRLVLIVKRGEIKVENGGREGELFIAKNGERVAATEYNDSELSRVPVEKPEISPRVALESAPQSLTEEEISSMVNGYRSSFFKCYTQVLQKDPTLKGDVSLGFTIENSGKLSVAEVTASKLSGQGLSEDFRKCLLDVLKRIEFRTFGGPPVSTVFPLKFE